MDDELIGRIKKGDERAFEQMVKTYEKKVYNIAYRMLGDADAAYDASQEVFIKIYNSIHTFKGDSLFSTWVYRITVNVCIDQKRANERRKVVYLNATDENDENVTMEISDDNYSPEVQYEKKEVRQLIAQGLEKLSPEHRAIIVLREIQGLSYDEITKILGCSDGTMKSRLNRARERLRNTLIEQGNILNYYKSNK